MSVQTCLKFPGGLKCAGVILGEFPVRYLTDLPHNQTLFLLPKGQTTNALSKLLSLQPTEALLLSYDDKSVFKYVFVSRIILSISILVNVGKRELMLTWSKRVTS